MTRTPQIPPLRGMTPLGIKPRETKRYHVYVIGGSKDYRTVAAETSFQARQACARAWAMDITDLYAIRADLDDGRTPLRIKPRKPINTRAIPADTPLGIFGEKLPRRRD